MLREQDSEPNCSRNAVNLNADEMKRGQVEVPRERSDQGSVHPGVVNRRFPRGDVIWAFGFAIGDKVKGDHVIVIAEEIFVELVVEEL